MKKKLTLRIVGDNFLYYELDIEGELDGEIIINNNLQI